MEKGTIYLITLGVILVGAISLSNYLNVWSANILYGMLILVALLGLFYIFLFMDITGSSKKVKDDSDGKTDLSYCVRKVNEKLRKAPGQDTISWEEGLYKDTRISTKEIDGEDVPFRSIIAPMQRKNQTVLIIWNCRDEEVFHWIANPSPAIRKNPFQNLEFFRDKGQGMMYGRNQRMNNAQGRHQNMGYNVQNNQDIEQTQQEITDRALEELE